MSPWLPKATVAIEDRRFYQHGGLDYLGIARALWADVRAGRVVEGGSTIDQELVRTLYVGSQQTFGRKIREACLAVKLSAPHVINYDVPEHADDYVHRIGRTGRAFTEGDAVTLVSFEEERMMPGIEAFIGQEIPRKALDGFQYLVPPRLHAYKPPLSSKFRIRRSIPRGGGSRFKR